MRPSAKSNDSIRHSRTELILGIGLAIGSINPYVFAQESPEYDNIFGLYPQNFAPILRVDAVSVITSADGFDNFDIGVDFAEPHASTNPRNPLQYFTAWNVNTARNTMNGHNWTGQTPNFGASMQGDPVTAYDSLGNLYYENMYATTGIVGCRVIRSTDNGATWSAGVTAISGVDKNWIACDQTMGPYANYVYTTMTSSSGGNFARSTDFGATWTTTFTPTTQSLPGMMVAVGPNVLGGNNISGGCVCVVTNSGSSFAATYTFYRSTNGGLTFSLMSTQNFANYVGTYVNGRNSIENMRTRPYPFIAADNSYSAYRGRLYLVYASNNPSGNGNKPDVYCRYSTDQGATWSAAVTINDDPNSVNNHNWFPSIWCDKNTGRLYAKWYDSRNSPASDSTDVYASYSENGGVSWVSNQRLTNAKFKVNCSTCGGGGTPRYHGDYDAIMSNPQGAMAVWTDFRNGNFGSTTAYFPDFAMLVTPTGITMFSTDSSDIRVKVPAVKLYSHSVTFSAAISPAGSFSFSYPQGNSLISFPDSVVLRIKTSSVTPGNYTLTITGNGPNGTPVHRRTVAVTVQVQPPTITVTHPNGGEGWTIGSSQNIAWTSVNLSGNVKIELSTNGGTTFPTTLFASTADDGSEQWTVTGPPTTNALVRVSSISSPTVVDVSNGPFTISASFALLTKLYLRDQGADVADGDSLEFGTGEGATDGIDAVFGEYEQPPLPPLGVFDVRWSIAGTQGTKRDVRDTLGGIRQQIIYTGKLQPGGGGYPFVVKWNRQELPSGTFTLRDGPSGFYFIVNMKQQDSLEISDEAVQQFQLVYDLGNVVYSSVQSGWNIVSLPVTMGDRRKTTVFPTSVTNAFAYTPSGYVSDDTLEYGIGYWLKFPTTLAVSLTGDAITVDTVDVVQGWNIIGSISSSVPVGSIVQIPGGIVASQYFGYTGGTYTAASSIDPMKGYWVKVTQNGKLVLMGGSFAVQREHTRGK